MIRQATPKHVCILFSKTTLRKKEQNVPIAEPSLLHDFILYMVKNGVDGPLWQRTVVFNDLISFLKNSFLMKGSLKTLMKEKTELGLQAKGSWILILVSDFSIFLNWSCPRDENDAEYSCHMC